MIRRVAGGTLAGIAVVVVALAGLWQLDGFKRWLVVVFDQTPAFPAAAASDALSPTFDGLDADREHLAVKLTPVITGVEQPTDVQFVPGHPTTAIALSKQGTAYRATLGGEVEPWFSVEVATASELGLLGLAFHPDFGDNGLFFVHYTVPADGRKATSRITRWRTDPKTLAAPEQLGAVLEVAQPFQNHNAGQVQFGPDGMLYVGFGDGGFRADPHGNGQDTSTLLGSMLRLDVDEAPYTVPDDNPLVGTAGARPEIWAWGLRNPWRFAFAPDGRMVIGDVGQNEWEEVSIAARGDNLGWKIREAAHCFEPETGCRTEGLVDPVWEYGRDDGNSITGGVVATAGPLAGRYVFGDFGSGRMWALTLPDTTTMAPSSAIRALGRWELMPVAFEVDAEGQAYVADYRRGAVYRLDAP